MEGKKKGFVTRFFRGVDTLFLVVGCVLGCILGVAGAYLLGHVFGMGLEGYAIGLIVGFGLGCGVLSFSW